MSHKTLFLNAQLYEYMRTTSLRQLPVQRDLLNATAKMAWAGIESAPEQVQLLQLLVQLMGAKRCLEIGVFTGYTTLAVAMAIPDDGRVVACDIDPNVTQVAREYWKRAGVAEKIDLRIAPALRTLDHLLAEGHGGSFDFAYIDADKLNGEEYYERVLLLLRDNGLMAVDNVFWGGLAADPAVDDRDTRSVRALNAKVGHDDRVDISMVPIGDGIMLVRKRCAATASGGQA